MSTISASTTSTTAYKVTADTTGTLVLQTGSTPTTAVTIDTSQKVGIGTSSPNRLLSLYATQPVFQITNVASGNTQGTIQYQVSGSTDFILDNQGSGSGGNIIWMQAGTERARIDTSGNFIIANGGISLANNQGPYWGGGTAYISYNTSSNYMSFGTNSVADRMRIDSNGVLLVGKTNYTINTAGQEFGGATGYAGFTRSGDIPVYVQRLTNTGDLIQFRYNGGGAIGSISTNGSSTSYNTSSDYRLKENIAPMTGALAKVAALKPVTYTWKSTGEADEGFIAHELQEVCPSAVSGVKDGTQVEQYEISPAVPATFDAEGNELTPAVEAVMGEREVPVYQGIDTSFLVATLTAAIQEQQAIIETLTNRITALEAK